MAEAPVNQSTKPATSGPKPASEAREGFPVRELRFSSPQGREVPLPGSHGGNVSQRHFLKTGAEGESFVEIEYRPWTRHHHVVWWPNGKPEAEDAKTGRKRGEPVAFNIPEAWALWVE